MGDTNQDFTSYAPEQKAVESEESGAQSRRLFPLWTSELYQFLDANPALMEKLDLHAENPSSATLPASTKSTNWAPTNSTSWYESDGIISFARDNTASDETNKKEDLMLVEDAENPLSTTLPASTNSTNWAPTNS